MILSRRMLTFAFSSPSAFSLPFVCSEQKPARKRSALRPKSEFSPGPRPAAHRQLSCHV